MNDFLLLCMVPLLFFGGLCVLVFLINKPYYSVAVYFFGVFVRNLFWPNIQVRVQVTVNLCLIFLLLLLVLVGNLLRENKKIFPSKVPCFWGLVFCLMMVIPVEAINGLLSGYSLFQVLVDIYKVVEILILFIFIRMTWRSLDQANKAFQVLVVEMCIFGVVELFTTERGGTGLNILMSILPIVIAVRFEKKFSQFSIIMLIATIILIFSKTRTYIIGMFFGVVMVLILGKGIHKHRLFRNLSIAAVTGVALIVALGNILPNSTLNEVLKRFQVLFSEGVSAAGGYRIYEIQMALSKFKQAPLIGKGYGYMEYVYIKLMGNFVWGDFMHNSYVEILCKTGLYGSLIYGIGLAIYLYKQYSLIQQSSVSGWTECRGVLVGGLCATLSWLLVYMTAPLSSYGSVFLPGIFSLTYFSLYMKEYSHSYYNK